MSSSIVYVKLGKPSKFYLKGKRINVDTAFGLYKKKAKFMSFGSPQTRSKTQHKTTQDILRDKYGRDVIVYNITEDGRNYNRFFYPSTGIGNERFKNKFRGLYNPMYDYDIDGVTLMKGIMQRKKQFPEMKKEPSYFSFFPWQQNLITHMLKSKILADDIGNLKDYLDYYVNTPGELAVTLSRNDGTQENFLQNPILKSEITDWIKKKNIQFEDVTDKYLDIPGTYSTIYTNEIPTDRIWKNSQREIDTRRTNERVYRKYSAKIKEPYMYTIDEEPR